MFPNAPRDPALLAYGILRLGTDLGERERLGLAARSRIVEQFSIERSARRYERLYRELANGMSQVMITKAPAVVLTADCPGSELTCAG